jgi:GNAT superfamily N-acetyltransferase
LGPLSGVEKLTERHEVSSFDCGTETLSLWLRRFALVNQKNDSAQTFVVHRRNTVVGYYSLTAGSVRPDEATPRIAKGLARHPIGVILLARLAVESREKGQGLGKALLKDALLRAAGAADTIGARAVLVHAIDEAARRFYEHFGFERSPLDEFELMLLMKDLRAQLRQ